MEYVNVDRDEGVAVVRLQRGKVHALNDHVVEELFAVFTELEDDAAVGAVIFTGTGKFFSFGFDIPGFMDYSRDDFRRYLEKFTGLYRYLFLFPKPVVAALNGHTVAGGCMLATTCDYRVMAAGKARISLNEVTFRSSVFAGSVVILKHCVGPRNAEKILESGAMYSAEQAQAMGLVDLVAPEENVMAEARRVAAGFAATAGPAFASIKRLLRASVLAGIDAAEKESIDEFIDIWYSPATRENLKKIEIRP